MFHVQILPVSSACSTVYDNSVVFFSLQGIHSVVLHILPAIQYSLAKNTIRPLGAMTTCSPITGKHLTGSFLLEQGAKQFIHDLRPQ